MCRPPPPRVGSSSSVVFPPPHTLPVGGRLPHFKDRWIKTLRLTPWHIQALDGVPIDWEQAPPENKPFDSALRYKPGSKERLACSKTLQHYLDIQSVRVLSPDTSDGLWSTFFPVPKKGTDKMRGCVDLRRTNECIKYEHFKMEGLHTVAQMLRRNDYMTKIDISDFYHHFLLQQQDSRYMRFMWEGVKYECIGMPFGLAPAPRLATKLLAPVIRHLRRLGLRVSVYIDDIICLARSITRSIAHTQVAVDTLHYLGFSVHPEKCNLIPLRSQEFLGTQVNSKKMQFRVAREKIRNIRREIQAVFKANDLHQLTVRNLASLLGKLNALRGAVVSAQLHLWPFHHLMKDALAKARWVDCTALDPPVVEEMWWWHDQMKDWSGKSIIPTRSQMVVTTDASSHGWGGWWRQFGQSGTLRNEARGFWLPQEQKMSSNARELSGVLLTVQAALSKLRGKQVLVETDNKATQAYINHLGGRSRFLNSIARKLWTMCYSNGILLTAVHRPGKVNQRADLLSRWKKDHTDIRLPPSSFQLIEQHFGPHSVDLFATRDNRLLPRFVSWRPDPESLATDAFMFPLKGENPYCFPPVACIPRLLREVLHQQATVSLVAPDWAAPWMPDLRRMLIAPPVRLPDNPVQTVSSDFRNWKLTCFRISGSLWKTWTARKASSHPF